MDASISVSAQFGGNDAATALLPHLWALKRAAVACVVPTFPYPEIAFILRVDGDVSSYGESGISHLDLDRNGTYLSLDIGISRTDRTLLGSDDPMNPIVGAIHAATPFLRAQRRLRGQIDFETLKVVLATFANAYRTELRMK